MVIRAIDHAPPRRPGGIPPAPGVRYIRRRGAEPATNRGETQPKFDSRDRQLEAGSWARNATHNWSGPRLRGDLHRGLDKVKLKAPIAPGWRPTTEHGWSLSSTQVPGESPCQPRGTLTVDLPGGSRRIEVHAWHNSRPDDRYWVSIEFNPRHWLDHPTALLLCPIDEAREITATIWEALSKIVPFGCDLGEARVARLDLARNFYGVKDPARVLMALSGLKRKFCRSQELFRNPAGVAQTLYVGTEKTGRVMLYDKYAESGPPCPEGTMRVEAQCAKGWLDRYGQIRTWSDVTKEAFDALLLNRWEWSQMGSVIVDGDAALSIITNRAKSASEAAQVWLHLCLLQAGEPPMASPNTVRRNNGLIRKWGIVVAPHPMRRSGEGIVLDFTTGRERITTTGDEHPPPCLPLTALETQVV